MVKIGGATLEDVAPYFHLPIEEAARTLGVCSSALKRRCRKLGIKRWPFRKVRSMKLSVARNMEDLNFSGASGAAILPAMLRSRRRSESGNTGEQVQRNLRLSDSKIEERRSVSEEMTWNENPANSGNVLANMESNYDNTVENFNCLKKGGTKPSPPLFEETALFNTPSSFSISEKTSSTPKHQVLHFDEKLMEQEAVFRHSLSIKDNSSEIIPIEGCPLSHFEEAYSESLYTPRNFGNGYLNMESNAQIPELSPRVGLGYKIGETCEEVLYEVDLNNENGTKNLKNVDKTVLNFPDLLETDAAGLLSPSLWTSAAGKRPSESDVKKEVEEEHQNSSVVGQSSHGQASLP